MLSAGSWKLSQANTILFVLVDSSGVEVAGLGSTFVLQISKNGAAFAGSAGTKSEVSAGWYKYICTAAEADTIGPVAIKVTHASIVQQNLEYVCEQRTAQAIEFTYTVTSSVPPNLPIDGVYVIVSTDAAGTNIVFSGYTDAFGILRDSNGGLPRLDVGLYAFIAAKAGYTFPVDWETVS